MVIWEKVKGNGAILRMRRATNLLDAVEDGQTEVGRTTSTGLNTTNHLGSIGNSLFTVEGTLEMHDEVRNRDGDRKWSC
jgi:hypothetical protein